MLFCVFSPMSEKITVEDLVTRVGTRKRGAERVADATKDAIYDVVKDDIKVLARPKHARPTQKPSFYELVPLTELEKSIQRALSHKDVDVTVKRRENTFLFEFDKKMQRFNKIKSKRFRKIRRLAKRRKLDAENITLSQESDDDTTSEECSDSEVEIESGEQQVSAVAYTSHPIVALEASKKVVAEAVDEDFAKEKREIVQRDMPQTQEIVLPGWGSWGGQGCTVKKTRANTVVKHTEGIKPQERKDEETSNMIINEHQPQLGAKYKINLPHGYTREEYLKKIKAPVSKELNSLRIFNKFVKPVFADKSEEMIEDFHFEPQYEE